MKPIFLSLLFAISGASVAADVRDFELRRLFDPTASEIKAEKSGRIFIYEGLRDLDVERAMRDEFDRIDSMMFIRVQVTDEDGEVKKQPATGAPAYEDDGC